MTHYYNFPFRTRVNVSDDKDAVKMVALPTIGLMHSYFAAIKETSLRIYVAYGTYWEDDLPMEVVHDFTVSDVRPSADYHELHFSHEELLDDKEFAQAVYDFYMAALAPYMKKKESSPKRTKSGCGAYLRRNRNAGS